MTTNPNDQAARAAAREKACCPDGCRRAAAHPAFCYSKFETHVDGLIDAYLAALPPTNVEAEREDWQTIETAPRAHMNCEMKGRYTDEGTPGLYAFRATHWRARSQKDQT